jgi:hypothetical protein
LGLSFSHCFIDTLQSGGLAPQIRPLWNFLRQGAVTMPEKVSSQSNPVPSRDLGIIPVKPTCALTGTMRTIIMRRLYVQLSQLAMHFQLRI